LLRIVRLSVTTLSHPAKFSRVWIYVPEESYSAPWYAKISQAVVSMVLLLEVNIPMLTTSEITLQLPALIIARYQFCPVIPDSDRSRESATAPSISSKSILFTENCH